MAWPLDDSKPGRATPHPNAVAAAKREANKGPSPFEEAMATLPAAAGQFAMAPSWGVGQWGQPAQFAYDTRRPAQDAWAEQLGPTYAAGTMAQMQGNPWAGLAGPLAAQQTNAAWQQYQQAVSQAADRDLIRDALGAILGSTGGGGGAAGGYRDVNTGGGVTLGDTGITAGPISDEELRGYLTPAKQVATRSSVPNVVPANAQAALGEQANDLRNRFAAQNATAMEGTGLQNNAALGTSQRRATHGINRGQMAYGTSAAKDAQASDIRKKRNSTSAGMSALSALGGIFK